VTRLPTAMQVDSLHVTLDKFVTGLLAEAGTAREVQVVPPSLVS
jgi:hypothetical protein